MDQATTLRKMCESASPIASGRPSRRVQVVAVTSGKGGVGKTNVVANLAVALAQSGKRVMVLDADLGLGNLDVLLGLVPKQTIEHVLAGQTRLSEIAMTGPQGVLILPASSGIPDLTALTPQQQLLLRDELDQITEALDVLLIDTAAGISSNVLFFAVAAQEILVVASPEPTSLTDAYALMKVLSRRHSEKRFRFLVNMARNHREGRDVFRRIGIVADRYLNVSIDYVGIIPADDYVPMAVCRQRAVTDLFPQAPASRAFHRLAAMVAQWELPEIPKGSIEFFWQRLIEASMTAER